jgi:hypothetical protein
VKRIAKEGLIGSIDQISDNTDSVTHVEVADDAADVTLNMGSEYPA